MTHGHAVCFQHACFHVKEAVFFYVRNKICPWSIFMKQLLLDRFISAALYQLRALQTSLLMLVNAGTG